MKQLFFISAIFLFLSPDLVAQKFSRDYWHLGEIDLTSGETIKGQMQYDLENDQILVREPTKLQVYRAEKVEAFQFKDALTGETRYFFSLPYALQNNYKRAYFFELLTEGDATNLLTREAVVQNTRYYNDPFWIGGSQTYTVLEQVENYFLMDSDANINPLSATSEGVLNTFPKQVQKLKTFIKDNRLKLDRRVDMITLIAYYNKLASGE